MASQTEENYLKVLFLTADKNGETAITDLSTTLQVSAPTANSMVKNLSEKGLVNYEKYKPLSLTAKGKKEAALIIRKHRLTEMFLVQQMGFGWEEVHQIAEQIEHIQSPDFFDRMDKLLGYPTVDPHGSPIPDKNGKINTQPGIKLSECKTGDTVTITALTHSSPDFLKYLNSKNLSLGLKLKVISVEAFDGSMTIGYSKHAPEVFSHTVCERLLVKK
jgi:DtxR family Mn-dependent transcriptional regulator